MLIYLSFKFKKLLNFIEPIEFENSFETSQKYLKTQNGIQITSVFHVTTHVKIFTRPLSEFYSYLPNIEFTTINLQ